MDDEDKAPLPPERADAPLSPEIKTGRQWRLSWVWIVPLLALAVAVSLLASVWVRSGPTITISFDSASGVEADQTRLRYREVDIGRVKAVRVAPDRKHVLVDVQLQREGARYITQPNAKFWIVRPQVSLGGISGLNTLLSGVYISVDAPSVVTDDSPVTSFVGLENPPEVLNGQKGTAFELKAASLGSLQVGSRVYYRRIEVGRLVSYKMAPDGRSVDMQIFVQAPYDRFVTPDTRFWNDSGVDMSISPGGINVRTSGLTAVLNGGIAFAPADETSTFEGSLDETPAKAGSTFTLFDTRARALADPDGPPVAVEMRFNQSVHGLAVGANVDFQGMALGKVVDIDLEFDAEKRRFYSRIRAQLFPMRFSEAYRALVAASHGAEGEALLKPLIRHGLRAELRTASLLTGQQYIALTFVHDEDKLTTPIPGEAEPTGYLIPTVQGDFDRLQSQLAHIVTKIDDVPIAEIGTNLDQNLTALQALLKRLDKQLAPQASNTLVAVRRSLDQLNTVLGPDAPLMGGMQDTLVELNRAARALRLLADGIQAHPESLLRGRARDTLR